MVSGLSHAAWCGRVDDMAKCWRSHPALFNYVCVYYLPSKTHNSQQKKTDSSR